MLFAGPSILHLRTTDVFVLATNIDETLKTSELLYVTVIL
jgi:hypothetical protein